MIRLLIIVVDQVNNDLDTIHCFNYAIISVMGEVVFLCGSKLWVLIIYSFSNRRNKTTEISSKLLSYETNLLLHGTSTLLLFKRKHKIWNFFVSVTSLFAHGTITFFIYILKELLILKCKKNKPEKQQCTNLNHYCHWCKYNFRWC